MSVSVVLPYMFRSISLTILRGCSCCNATLRFVVFVTTLSWHVAVLSICVVVVCTSLLTGSCLLKQIITNVSQTQHVILIIIYSNMFRLTEVIIRLSLNDT